jgi:hypothetical protein
MISYSEDKATLVLLGSPGQCVGGLKPILLAAICTDLMLRRDITVSAPRFGSEFAMPQSIQNQPSRAPVLAVGVKTVAQLYWTLYLTAQQANIAGRKDVECC